VVVGLSILNHPFRKGDIVLDEMVQRTSGNRVLSIPDTEDLRSAKAMMTTVYLAHPVPMKEVGDALQIELEKAGFEVYNPFKRNVAEKPRSYQVSDEEAKAIVEGDLALMNQVDGMVAMLVGDQSIGTLMEIFYMAHVLRRPVFTLVKEDWKATHPWIKYYTRVHRTLDTLIADLRAWVVAKG
jgi:nucleoside 2-deoxyribosyltransferase